MNSFFIYNYLNLLDEKSAKLLAKKHGIIFTDLEVSIILKYLKDNYYQLNKLPSIKRKIHTDLKNKISVNSINNLYLLLNKIGIY